MRLSDELAVEFAKITNDTDKDKSPTTVNATIVEYDGKKYARLDGAEEGMLTPIENTTEVNADDRVVGTIRNHTLTVTGNATDPSAGSKLMKDTVTGATSEFKQTANGFMFEVTDAANNAKSTIEQTASSLKTEIQNTATNEKSAITQTANEVKSEISNSLGEWTEFKQTIEGFAFMDKGGTVKISGGDIELTGSIRFSDLDDATQGAINGANNAANAATKKAESAYSLAEDAMAAAGNGSTVVLPEYIKDTYIDSARIESPDIVGGNFYAVGTDLNSPDKSFAKVDEDGFYLYHPTNSDMAYGNPTKPKLALICPSDSNGKYVQLILGEGDGETDISNRFYISKFSSTTQLHYYANSAYYSGNVGFNFNHDGTIGVRGTKLTGTAFVDSIFPPGSIYLSFSATSPAYLFGGSWNQITGGRFLYATGDSSQAGGTGDVVIAGGTNTAKYVKILAWERVS